MHRFLKTGYTKSYPSLVGPAVPREHDCVWANVTRSPSINARNTAIVRKGNQKNGSSCFVIKKRVLSSYWPVYLLSLPPRPTWCCDMKIHLHAYVSASTVSLCYRTCRHISVSTVKRHQTTSRYNGIDGKLENTSHMHNRSRSFQAVRGTVKVTVPYRNFFHPQTSNQICFPEKSLESYFPAVLETAQQMKDWHFQLPNLLSSLCVKSLLWDTQGVPVLSLKMSIHLWVRWTQNLNM